MSFPFQVFVFVACVTQVDSPDKQTQLKCPEKVEITVGQDVTLNCSLVPPRDVRDKIHEWKLNTTVSVLVYRHGDYSEDDQNVQFKFRASSGSFTSLTEGRLSVRILNLTRADGGTYSCHVDKRENRTSCTTELTIVDPKQVKTENSDKTQTGDTNRDDNSTGGSPVNKTGIGGIAFICGIIGVIIGVIGY